MIGNQLGIASILFDDLEMHLAIFYRGRLDFATEMQRESANYLVTDEPSRSRAKMISDKTEAKLLRHGMEYQRNVGAQA